MNSDIRGNDEGAVVSPSGWHLTIHRFYLSHVHSICAYWICYLQTVLSVWLQWSLLNTGIFCNRVCHSQRCWLVVTCKAQVELLTLIMYHSSSYCNAVINNVFNDTWLTSQNVCCKKRSIQLSFYSPLFRLICAPLEWLWFTPEAHPHSLETTALSHRERSSAVKKHLNVEPLHLLTEKLRWFTLLRMPLDSIPLGVLGWLTGRRPWDKPWMSWTDKRSQSS